MRSSRRTRRNNLVGWGLVAPALLCFAVFSVYPLLSGIGMAFYEYKGWDIKFVGLANFRNLGPAFPHAIANTMRFVVFIVPIIVTVPMALAFMARDVPRTAWFLRLAVYLPALTTAVLMTFVWRWIFSPNQGLLNYLLGLLGIAPVMWLCGIPASFIACCIVMVPLNMGGALILYSVAIANIPEQLYDMAAVDGCTRRQRAWYVTIPAILPTVGLVALLTSIGMMQVWMVPQMLTGGGPLYSTTTLLMDLYNNAFVFGRYGRASAEGLILMGITASLALVQARFVWRVV